MPRDCRGPSSQTSAHSIAFDNADKPIQSGCCRSQMASALPSLCNGARCPTIQGGGLDLALRLGLPFWARMKRDAVALWALDIPCVSHVPTYMESGESSEGFSRDVFRRGTLISDGKRKA
jgi:hypothetical protein